MVAAPRSWYPPGVDLSEVIADAVRREVDFRRVAKVLARRAYGLPTYTWLDEQGRTQVSDEPPPGEPGRYVVTARVPADVDQDRAARTLKDWAAPKTLRVKLEGGAPQRTDLDEWLDRLPIEQLQRMLGPSSAGHDDVEVESVESTVPGGSER